LWSRRKIFFGLCLLAAGLFLIPRMSTLLHFVWRGDGRLNWPAFVQVAVFSVGGLSVLALAGADLWRRRDAVSLLLLCWIGGVFVFATAVNWTINGRTLLPAVPSLGILIARRLERRRSGNPVRLWKAYWPVLPTAALGLLLAEADYAFANAQRAAARELGARYCRRGNRVWFEGHWGFQYYLEAFGARALDLKNSQLHAGDFVLLPFDSRGYYDNSIRRLRCLETRRYAGDARCAVMNHSRGAGFYASAFGPMPFVLGIIPPQNFYVYEAPLSFTGSRPSVSASNLNQPEHAAELLAGGTPR
jgi:hypothetical protein